MWEKIVGDLLLVFCFVANALAGFFFLQVARGKQTFEGLSPSIV